MTVILLVAPLAFLVGIGGFDYWGKWMIGAPTEPEDHSGHGARSWRDYFRVNTDHKVIGIQYTVTALLLPVVAGGARRGDARRAGAAGPAGRRLEHLQRPLLGPRRADDLPGRDPDLRGARELRDPADDRRAGHGVPAPERAQLLAAAGRGRDDDRELPRPRRRRLQHRLDRLRAAYRPTRRSASSSSRSACSSRARRRS